MIRAIRNNSLYFFIALASSCTLFSCDASSSIVNLNQPIDESGWAYNDTIQFQFDVEDTLSLYDFSFIVRNNDNYKWSNLYLFTTMTFPNKKSRTDTLEITLADKYGRWNGNDSGTIITNEILYQHKRKFPLKGVYSITVNHAMRDDKLTNLKNIGFVVSKTKQ